MLYQLAENGIEVFDKTQFNITHILECGQIFTYETTDDGYVVFSDDKKAILTELEDKIFIQTNTPEYFVDFFDLKTDYNKIKEELVSKFEFLKPMLDYGSGIRILKQSLLETIIGFIISANNNIKRIKKSMDYIRKHAGSKVEDYYAFPTLDELSEKDEAFFISANLGYRAKHMVKAIRQLKEMDFENLYASETAELKKQLLTIQGIGPKVADCILLFAFARANVFPVDTWIEKIFHEYFDPKCFNREQMRNELVQTFSNLSGYAQQYLFYYKRSAK